MRPPPIKLDPFWQRWGLISLYISTFISSIVLGPVLYNAQYSRTFGNAAEIRVSMCSMDVNPVTFALYAIMFLLWLFYKPPIEPFYEDENVSTRRRVAAIIIDYILLSLAVSFALVFISLCLEAVFEDRWHWQWGRPYMWRDNLGFIIVGGLCLFAFTRLMKLLSSGRATFGQFLLRFRLVYDETGQIPSKGRRLAAYLGVFKTGDDLWQRLKFTYDAKQVRSKPPFLRAVSTRPV